MKIDKKRKVGHPFYSSARWLRTRDDYLSCVHYMCETVGCGRPAQQVHHIDPLTEEDYFVNYEKCYGFDNLRALCRDCHNRQEGHWLDGRGSKQAIADGFAVDMTTGDIVVLLPQGGGDESKPRSR